MKTPFPVDHDLHIHTLLSSCSRDPEQTTARILRYAKENGFRQVAVTEHFWDTAIFANRNGKLFLPISIKSSYVREPLTTFDDQPAENVDAFYSENAAQLQAANAEMMRPLTR